MKTAAELLVRAGERTPLVSGDGKSEVPLERVRIDGTAYVVKRVSPRWDWIARATGEYGSRVLTCWQVGVLDRLPGCIDHAIVDVAYDPHELATTLLMHDVAAYLVPEGSTPISSAQHRRFIEHMAALHATFWSDAASLPVLTPMSTRFTALTPLTTQVESALGTPAEVPAMLAACWDRLCDAVPDAGALARGLAHDPWPLVAALDATPQTFIHGDWKLGNLGSHPDGRTILLDWQWPGTGPACLDLAWYLAVNCDRLPESKEDTIDAYRGALESCGIMTQAWFDRQLALCLLGAFVQMGWCKTHDPVELGWWVDHALRGAELTT